MTIENNSVILNINAKVYALETVYSAAYVFLDRAYVLLDGDPEKDIIVKLKPKGNEDLEKLGGEFFNELINYGDYKKRAEQTKSIREMLLQRALIANDPSLIEGSDNEFEEILDEFEDDDDYLDDPEGIAIPWEEKYGKEEENKEDAKQEDEKQKNEKQE